MSVENLQMVYKTVIISRLTCTSNAWWDYTTADGMQRIASFVRRGIRIDFYTSKAPTIAELVEDSDDKLFRNIRYNENHILYQLLPAHVYFGYNLRPTPHDRQLPSNHDKRNFINRLLFNDIY